MLRKLCPLIVLCCASMSGCAVIDLGGKWPGRTPGHVTGVGELMREAEIAEEQFQREQIAGTPRGSWVNVYISDQQWGRNQSFLGTLLTASSDRIELSNCICQETVPGPDGPQCQMSHVPFRSLPISQGTRFMVVAPPSEAQPARSTLLVAEQFEVQAITLMSGRQQRCGAIPLPRVDDRSREELADRILAVPAGTQITFVDESGRQYVARLLKAGPSGVEVMNCVFQEVVPGIDGESQLKTIHQPTQIYSLASITAFEIVAAAPAGFSIPVTGLESEEYILSDFVLKNGQHIAKRGPRAASGNAGNLGRSR